MSVELCTFELDGLLFGVDVDVVQEVMREQVLTRVPRAPAVVRGLIHLRGQIVTAIDLRVRLGLERRERAAMNVLVRDGDGGVVSLQVDEIGDVLELEDDLLEQPPDTLAPLFRELVTGVFKLEDRLLLVLDVGRITTFGANSTSSQEPHHVTH